MIICEKNASLKSALIQVITCSITEVLNGNTTCLYGVHLKRKTSCFVHLFDQLQETPHRSTALVIFGTMKGVVLEG
jgi:hypothetical protein